MGHYDDCREDDARRERERANQYAGMPVKRKENLNMAVTEEIAKRELAERTRVSPQPKYDNTHEAVVEREQKRWEHPFGVVPDERTENERILDTAFDNVERQQLEKEIIAKVKARTPDPLLPLFKLEPDRVMLTLRRTADRLRAADRSHKEVCQLSFDRAVEQYLYLFGEDAPLPDFAFTSEPRPVDGTMKSWPAFFQAIKGGYKLHDIRSKKDRTFEVGQRWLLQEYDPFKGEYTGDSLVVEITYITSNDTPCAYSSAVLDRDAVVLSLKVL
jgi:hypothetical protein